MTFPHPIPVTPSGPPALPIPRQASASDAAASTRSSDVADEPVQLRPDPLRWRVIDRLVLAGHRHAGHLLDRHAHPATRPARHAVVFVFDQPRRGTDDGLRIAQRMFLDGSDDVTDLTTVLTALADRVSDYRRARHGPLARIIDRHEPIAREARFLATVTSSLEPVSPSGDPAAPRPWRGLAHLVDDTQLVVRTRVHPTALLPETAALDVASTHTLAVATPLEPFGRGRRWRYIDHTDRDDPGLEGEQTALHRLHALITDSEHRPRRHHQRLP